MDNKTMQQLHTEDAHDATKAIQFYENNGFGKSTTYRANEITEWVKLLGKTKVLEAMQLAINNKILHWSYVLAILKYHEQLKDVVVPSKEN